MAGFERRLDRVTAFDAGEDLAVQCDVEGTPSELYPDPLSDQPQRCWHCGHLPLGPRGGPRRQSYTSCGTADAATDKWVERPSRLHGRAGAAGSAS